MSFASLNMQNYKKKNGEVLDIEAICNAMKRNKLKVFPDDYQSIQIVYKQLDERYKDLMHRIHKRRERKKKKTGSEAWKRDVLG